MVGSRWVNKIKADDLFKSRLVVLGWAQVPRNDCGGTFTPVLILQSIRLMLAIAAELDYEVLMLDVQTAFLNADVEEEIYVKMAPGYETCHKSGIPFVMKLKKSIYGHVTRDRKNGTITIDQKDYTEDILERYGMTNCNVAFTPGVGPEISLDQPADRLLDGQEKQRYQSIAGALLTLTQVTRYDIFYAVSQLARAISKPSKAQMGTAKHALLYLAGSANFPITYKRGDFKLTTYTNTNWGRNPDNGKSTSSYIMMLANGPISFKVSQSTMEAGGSCHRDEGVTLLQKYDDGNKFHGGISERSCLHRQHIGVARGGNRIFSPRAKHIALRYFFVQELVKEGKVTIHFVKTEQQLADLGTKHLKKHRRRFLVKLINECSEPERAFYL